MQTVKTIVIMLASVCLLITGVSAHVTDTSSANPTAIAAVALKD